MVEDKRDQKEGGKLRDGERRHLKDEQSVVAHRGKALIKTGELFFELFAGTVRVLEDRSFVST